MYISRVSSPGITHSPPATFDPAAGASRPKRVLDLRLPPPPPSSPHLCFALVSTDSHLVSLFDNFPFFNLYLMLGIHFIRVTNYGSLIKSYKSLILYCGISLSLISSDLIFLYPWPCFSSSPSSTVSLPHQPVWWPLPEFGHRALRWRALPVALPLTFKLDFHETEALYSS